MRFEDTRVIDARADTVWQLTIDVAAWPSFMPTVRRLDRLDGGPLAVGSRARIKQPGQSAAVWTVTAFEPGRAFMWRTVRPLVTMTGSHLVEDLGDRCRNTLRLDLAGPGARVFGLLFGGLMRRSLRLENEAFQARATRPAPAAS